MKEKDTDLLNRYRHLVEVIKDVASTLDLDYLPERVTSAAAALTSAGAASILLYDAQRAVLQFQHASNLGRPFIRGLAVPVESSLAGWVVRNRKPVIVDDPSSDPRFYPDIQRQTNIETRSLLAVPLIIQERVIGVVEVINKAGGHFTQVDQDLLMALGAQAAVAIENARLFARSDLITEIVHELRTPLSSLNAAATLLTRPELAESQREEIVLLIRQETQRLTDLTSSFLDLARLEAGQMEFHLDRTPLAEILEDCIQSIRGSMEERQVTLTLDIPEDLSPVTGDSTKLRQVFTNLLSNAVKFNRVGGEITIRAEENETETRIAIADTGRGIPSEEIDHLFEKFYRAAGSDGTTRGSGIGLHIVDRIVRAHGGVIEVESTPGTGSVFTVRLPHHES